MGAALLSRCLPGQRLLVVVLAVLTCLLGSQASALASAGTLEYDAAGYHYDVEAKIAHVDTDASAVLAVGRQDDARPSVVSAWHVYGSSASFVAPSAARAAGETSDVLLNSSRQLQRKWKHAADFGVEGNYNPANAARYSEALNQHINSPLTTAIDGTYRGNPVTHYLDPSTGLNVIADPAGKYVSGWRLGPEQLENVLRHGGLN